MQDHRGSRERENAVEVADSCQEEVAGLDAEKMVQDCDEDLADHWV